ncbi:MAG TPA: MarR family transcriptional regulator [Solirubrobacteraceae bacterium]|nr:MarR family transcriptional regulator [Solirubrobacteraceae bacterium]
MPRQLPAGKSRELAVALHDIAWLLPRRIDPWVEIEGEEPLPPTELEVMRLLVRAPDLSVGAVARELGLHASNASAAVRGLLARGLLERKADSRDGRISRLVPTAKAQAIRRRREGAWGELLRVRLARMPPEDAAALLGAVDSLSALAVALSVGED